jgi:hypothetical protein
MANSYGGVFTLTAFCPLRPESGGLESPAAVIRHVLNHEPSDHRGAMAKVPNTFFCRLLVLDDVIYQGSPAVDEHLQSKYLVFTATVYGDLDPYLRGMWMSAEPFVRKVFQFCVGFEGVKDEASFARYVRQCQVNTDLFFNGSIEPGNTEHPPAEQLKALYVQQEFTRFVSEHQGRPASEIQEAFKKFVARVRPDEVSGPTWRAGAASLDEAVVGADS